MSLSLARTHVTVRGIVQGVGFRPFVLRLARACELNGWVLNSDRGVEIEVEGDEERIQAFLAGLEAQAPPQASIRQIEMHRLPPAGYISFNILASHEEGRGFPLAVPDIATCPACLEELFERRNRRFRYPFINCTDCGPRFTIVESLPYDRERTTMKAFTMCRACESEYETPDDRRFHAQPNACQACGPRLWLACAPGVTADDDVTDPIFAAQKLLRAGQILAIKGLGGFHLACDARNPVAVRRLRERKGRADKPFALMVRDLATAHRLCSVDVAEAQLLSSPRRPIVLLEKYQQCVVAEGVAPGNRRLGLMLPYTPIHHLLLAPVDSCGVVRSSDRDLNVLVMTSGNISEEPLAKDNEEALVRLGEMADAFLLHDRPIHSRCDDSVTQVFEGREMLLRRARGYVPLPIQLPFHSENDLAKETETVLACGADLKNTFCLARGALAFLSQHIGDLEDAETARYYPEAIAQMLDLLQLRQADIRVIAHDMHPDYFSTRLALSALAGAEDSPNSDPGLIAVQHHHAHVASCMAENGLMGPVIGVACDGTGYGDDGAIWGGEFLLADYRNYTRVAHLKYVPLPGGALAIKKPYRSALSFLLVAYNGDLPQLELTRGIDPQELAIIRQQITRSINAPLTSSCGRLFDAVSALLGICQVSTYEGQAAIELEMAADPRVREGYGFTFSQSALLEIEAAPMIRAAVDDLRKGVERGVIAARFHNGMAQMITEVCAVVRRDSGLNAVCLGGGVFQNRLLLARTLEGLREKGFEAYTQHQVPCNDGGISLGQAVIASARANDSADLNKEASNVSGNPRTHHKCE